MKKLSLDIADIEIDSDVVICRPRVGVDIDMSACSECMSAVENLVPLDWNLVLDLIHPCSLQLAAIQGLRDNRKIRTLVAVRYRKLTDLAMRHALEMINKPGAVLDSLDQAREWIERNNAVDLSA